MNKITLLINKFKNLDENIKRIMKIGFKSSFSLCLIAVSILFTYISFYKIPTLFYIGISLLHSSLMFLCTFLICGIGFDTIKKQIV